MGQRGNGACPVARLGLAVSLKHLSAQAAMACLIAWERITQTQTICVLYTHTHIYIYIYMYIYIYICDCLTKTFVPWLSIKFLSYGKPTAMCFFELRRQKKVSTVAEGGGPLVREGLRRGRRRRSVGQKKPF